MKTIFLSFLFGINLYSDCDKAKLLFDAGKSEEAVELLKSDYEKCFDIKIDALISLGRFRDAKKEISLFLQKNPKDYEKTLIIARISSWIGEFNEAVEWYRKAVNLKNDDYIPNLEMARVLYWDKKYKEAVQSYDEAYRKTGFKWIEEEKLGKLKMKDAKPWSGISQLKKSYELNPFNSEALFDVCQFYSNSLVYHKARPCYDRLIEISPYNDAAKRAKSKNERVMRGFSFNSYLSIWNAYGAGRMTDVEYRNAAISAEKFIFDGFKLGLHIGRGFYYFTNNEDAKDLSVQALSEYRPDEKTVYGAVFKFIRMYENYDDRNSFDFYFGKGLEENLFASLSYGKENMINNKDLVKEDLNVKYLRTNIDWNLNGNLSLNFGYKNGDLSDGNSSNIYGFGLSHFFSREPSSFWTDLKWEKQKYSHTSTKYFAPLSYDVYSVMFGYKRNFWFDGLYYGAKNNFYEIKWRISHDNSPYISSNPSFGLFFDLNNNFNINLFYSFTDFHYYRDNYYGVGLMKVF